MTIMRHEDMVVSASTQEYFGPAYDPRPTNRYLVAAGFRISILFLVLCILIAVSI